MSYISSIQITWKHLAVFIVPDFLIVFTRKYIKDQYRSVLDPNRTQSPSIPPPLPLLAFYNHVSQDV